MQDEAYQQSIVKLDVWAQAKGEPIHRHEKEREMKTKQLDG
jgi:hypothetical protein